MIGGSPVQLHGRSRKICRIQRFVLVFCDPTRFGEIAALHISNCLQGAKTGKDNGYTMLFDIESFDYSYYDEGSEGLKVALVHHLDMPIMRQTGFHIAPGTENQIAVTPTLIVTSANAMYRFSPAERDCYSEDEISLKYLPRDHGYRYEMSNCLFESAFENILRECKCVPGEQIKTQTCFSGCFVPFLSFQGSMVSYCCCL